MDEEIDRTLRSWKNDFSRLKRRMELTVKRLEDGLKNDDTFEIERWRAASKAQISKFNYESCRYDDWLMVHGCTTYDRSIEMLQFACKGYVKRIQYLSESQGAE